MADYISRDAAIDAIWKPEVRPNDLIFDALRRACEEEVKHIPAADVRPVVRGRWEKHEDFDPNGGGRFVEWVCSECDKRLRGDWVTRNPHIEETPAENFCSNCGADMREVKADG